VESSGSPARNAFLTTAGVLGALALVAVAARGSTEIGEGAARRPTDALIDIVFTLYLLVMAAGAVLFVYLLVLQRRAAAKEGRTPKRSDIRALAILLLFGALAALAARSLDEWNPTWRASSEGQPAGTVSTPSATTQPLAPEAADPAFSWLPVLATLALILFAGGAWAFASRARSRARGELGPTLALAVADALTESLDDLRAEPDPRRAVIASYARLERVLAAHGVPRGKAEAPLEYLGRVLGELSVREIPARELTRLFERAKFSQHAVGPEMKERAISALETVRDDLLAARVLEEEKRLAVLAEKRSRMVAERDSR
jgi:Domain of unknown function (DUF4129)